MRYSREDGCRVWLSRAQLSWNTLSSLNTRYGCAEAAYEAFRSGKLDLGEGEVTEKQLSRLRKYADPAEMHESLIAMRDGGMGIMSVDDPVYPAELRNIADPPVYLFYIGDPACLNARCITVVGSRKPSPEALEATNRICRELAAERVAVISGLAMGIDAAAHTGCLDGGGITAAVLACGLDIHYPAENDPLRRRLLADDGLLLSEYPPGTQVFQGRFPVRNRILSGLSRATVMMECRLKSGTMHTIQHALDQGREVYAYPGIPNSPYSEGAHQLLREGAGYFTSANDLLEDLGWKSAETAVSTQELSNLLTPEQSRVLTEIAKGERSFEQIAAATGFPPQELSGILTMLQLMGMIRSLPGKTYMKL